MNTKFQFWSQLNNENSVHTTLHYCNSKQNDNHRHEHHHSYQNNNNNNNNNNDKNEKNNGNNQATSHKNVICSLHNQFVTTKESFRGHVLQFGKILDIAEAMIDEIPI